MAENRRPDFFPRIIFALLAAIVMLFAGLAMLSFVYLRSFTVFTRVDRVARVECRQEAPAGRPALHITFYSGPLKGQSRTIPFAGDEWVIEGRVVKWTNLAAFLGVKRYYRYERISGRYVDIEKERSAERTLYALAEKPDTLWSFFYRYQRLIPFIDAAYGNSAFVAFRPGAVFEVSITPSGFMIRDITEPRTRPWWAVG